MSCSRVERIQDLEACGSRCEVKNTLGLAIESFAEGTLSWLNVPCLPACNASDWTTRTRFGPKPSLLS